MRKYYLSFVLALFLSGCAAPLVIPGGQNERPDIGSIAAGAAEVDQ